MYLGRLEGIITGKFDVKEKDSTLVGCSYIEEVDKGKIKFGKMIGQ